MKNFHEHFLEKAIDFMDTQTLQDFLKMVLVDYQQIEKRKYEVIDKLTEERDFYRSQYEQAAGVDLSKLN